MDIIYLHGLKVNCVIGVWEWERQIRQTITLDLDMGFDISRAAASDDLQDTLSYKDVAKRVTEFVGESEFALVEKLAEEVATILRLLDAQAGEDDPDVLLAAERVHGALARRLAPDVGPQAEAAHALAAERHALIEPQVHRVVGEVVGHALRRGVRHHLAPTPNERTVRDSSAPFDKLSVSGRGLRMTLSTNRIT